MSERIIEGVGKKIVDALKQQSEIEINNVVENAEPVEAVEPAVQSTFENTDYDFETDNTIEFQQEQAFEQPQFEQSQFVQPQFVQPEPMTFNTQSVNSTINDKKGFAEDLDDFDIPTNVAVLKQLINRLPAGVSKQTGAQIIKQTMEALGISMKNVLQEAQQVQENINMSSTECQASIIEHKKQIGLLERQSQKLQRQYAALNDIISLFVQTNI